MVVQTMKNNPENRMTRLYWDDGILDLLSGIGVVLIGVTWVAGLIALGPMVPCILLPFWTFLRRNFTEVRLGHVEFSNEKQRGDRRFLLQWCFVGVGVLLTVFLFAIIKDGLPATNFAAKFATMIPAVLMAVLAIATAALTALKRFIWYSMVFLVAGVEASIREWDPGWSMIFGGIVMITCGTWILVRFITRFPLAIH
ncbi:MAG: hypothetical protein R3C03_13815 [Pirellulaceae bacterium]